MPPRREKIPPPGNKKDEFTNFMSKAKWKQALARQLVEIAGRNLRAQGMLIVGNALTRNRNVMKIDFSHNHIGDQGAIDFAQVLKVNDMLQTVDLSCNDITDIGGVAIASSFVPTPNPTGQPSQWNRTLWYLSMAGNLMRDDSMIAFSNAIGCHKEFTRLDIRDNGIGSSGAKSLLGAWKRNAQCIVLLSGNPLGDEGVGHLCRAWAGSTQVNLQLHHCDISKAGAEAIGALLETSLTLRDLNLSWNTLGFQGTEAIVDRLSLKKSVLYSINLQENCLDDDSAEEIARLLECNLETLKKIDIAHNEIKDKGGEAIGRALQKNTFVEYFNISFNSIGDRAVEQFAEAVKVTKTLIHLDIKKNVYTEAAKDVMFAAMSVNALVKVDQGSASATDDRNRAFDTLMKKIGDYMQTILTEEENAKTARGRRGRAGR